MPEVFRGTLKGLPQTLLGIFIVLFRISTVAVTFTVSASASAEFSVPRRNMLFLKHRTERAFSNAGVASVAGDNSSR